MNIFIDENAVADAVAEQIARAHGLEGKDDLLKRSRLPGRAEARRELFKHLSEERRWSSTEIAAYAKRNHTTVLYALGTLSKCAYRSAPSLRASELATAQGLSS